MGTGGGAFAVFTPATAAAAAGPALRVSSLANATNLFDLLTAKPS